MKLKLDENLGQRGKEVLAAAGHDVCTVPEQELCAATDTEAAEWFVREIGVAGVPGSSFFREPEHRFIRFHFAKQVETLDAAGVKLGRLKQGRWIEV